MFNRLELQIKKPVIIIGCSRSGTTLLFKILSSSKSFFSLYGESHYVWNEFFKVQQDKDKFSSDCLTAKDLDVDAEQLLLNNFHKYSFDNNSFKDLAKRSSKIRKFLGEINILYKKMFLTEYRIIEKTPRTCFMISFVDKLFPNCKFVYIKRDGRANISSLIEGWQSRSKKRRNRFPDVKEPVSISGYYGKDWKYIMPPGWEDYTRSSLEEVCAFQWISANQAATEGLKDIDDNRKYFTSYEELTENATKTIEKICDFAEIPFDEDIKRLALKPPVVAAVSAPKKDKWKKNIQLLEKIYPKIEPMMKELSYKMSD